LKRSAILVNRIFKASRFYVDGPGGRLAASWRVRLHAGPALA